MTVDDLLERAGELKGELLAFSQHRRYDRAFRELLASQDDGGEVWDEGRLMEAWDTFVLEYPLHNGRTVVEQFVDARPDLTPDERRMLLGWRDVVSGVFEVQRRDGPALILLNLVDELTYRTRSNAGTSVFRQMPKRSFLLTRVVAVGDEWMFSGPTTVMRPADRKLAVQVALELALRSPELVFRNPERLARAWELQRLERQRFIAFFGSDLVVVPGDEAQQRIDAFYAFCREQILREKPEARPRASETPVPTMALPPEVVEAETVAFIYDEDDGLEIVVEFGLVEEAFADPELLRRHGRYRDHVLGYLHDDSVVPMVFRRLADRDRGKASDVFRRVLKRPRFDWARDGEKLLRSAKPDYFAQPRLPKITPVGERLAAYARR
jgi:hypothetical protein